LIEGVLLTDNDEGQNRLYIGVQNEEARQAVLTRLVELGVPLEAVTIGFQSPVVPTHGIREKHRPVLGGLRIEKQPFEGGNPPDGFCSFGFVAKRVGEGIPGFVTNSHCTMEMARVESTIIHQDNIESGNPDRIGYEVSDPVPFIGGPCPQREECRMADAAWIRLDPGVIGNQGLIARTPDPEGMNWNDADAYWIRRQASVTQNELVYKVGQATGRTGGFVHRTNVTMRHLLFDITMVWQHMATYPGILGDSGAPVFAPYNGIDVTLYGLHWGEAEDPLTEEILRVFSDIQYMQFGQDLGSLEFYATSGGGGR
jgi:hypothetical protein